MQRKMRKRLSHNSLFLILLMGIFLIGPFSFAQDANTIPSVQEVKDQEVHSTEKLKEHMDNVLADDPTIAKTAVAPVKVKVVERPKPPPKDLSLVNLKPEELKQILSPLQALSKAELTNLLRESTKESPMAPYLKQNPRLVLFIVSLIHDKTAILGLFKITQDKARLKNYFFALIGTLFLGFMFSRILKNKEGGIPAQFILFCFRLIIMTSVRLWVTYFFFSRELDPTIKIFNKIFF